MLNHHINPSDNPENDHLKAAAIMFTARRREQEATELSAEGQPTSRRSNPLAAAMVAEILGSKTEAIPEEAKDAEASRDTPSLEAEELLAPSTEAQPPGSVQDDAPHADHERAEPSLPESELNIDEDSDPVRLPKQAREFGLLTRADVQAEPSANRATPGSDENLSTDMGMVIAHANLLINKTGAAVVLTHHTGKAKERGPRGHSSLYAALDTCLMVDETESGMRMVELVKTRQGPGGKKYYFTIENIALGEDDYGLPVVGPALTEVEGSPEVEKAATAPALTPQQKEALVALTLRMQNGPNGELVEGISRDEALEVVKAAFGAVSTKHRSTRAREAIDALIEAGRLMQSNSGMLSIVS